MVQERLGEDLGDEECECLPEGEYGDEEPVEAESLTRRSFAVKD